MKIKFDEVDAANEVFEAVMNIKPLVKELYSIQRQWTRGMLLYKEVERNVIETIDGFVCSCTYVYADMCDDCGYDEREKIMKSVYNIAVMHVLHCDICIAHTYSRSEKFERESGPTEVILEEINCEEIDL